MTTLINRVARATGGDTAAGASSGAPRRLPRWLRLVAAAVVVVVLVAVPSIVGDYRMLLANLMLVNVIVVLGLVILLGWSGQFAFTSAAFMAVGAYSGGLLTVRHPELPLEVALLVSVLSGVVVGAVFGLAATRVRQYYLAISTIAFMYLLQLLLRQGGETTGGVDGFLTPYPTVWVLGGREIVTVTDQYYVGLVLAGLVLLGVIRLRRTPLARGWVTLKHDDRYAQAIGVNVYASRLAGFVIASAIFSLAGCWFAFVGQFVEPNLFGFDVLMSHFIYLVVGGITSPIWVIISAAGLTATSEYVRGFTGLSEIVFGVILLVSVLVLRNGLYGLFNKLTGRREEWT